MKTLTEKSVIVVDKRKMIDLLFPLAILHKSLCRTSASVHLLTFGPGDRCPLEEVENEMAKIPSACSLYLIGIEPTQEIQLQEWQYFAEKYGPRIKFWLSQGVSAKALPELNKLARPFFNVPKRSQLVETLKLAGYHSWGYLEKADQAWIGTSAQKISASRTAYRYNMALIALLQMGAEPTSYQATLLVIDALKEMRSGRYSPYINQLVDWRQKSIEYTLTALTKFRDDFFYFLAAKRRSRPVGFADLGTIPDYADIPEILRFGNEIYPHLAVVHYLHQGQSIVRYGSVIIDLNLKLNPAMTAEAMYRKLNEAVLREAAITIN